MLAVCLAAQAYQTLALCRPIPEGALAPELAILLLFGLLGLGVLPELVEESTHAGPRLGLPRREQQDGARVLRL